MAGRGPSPRPPQWTPGNKTEFKYIIVSEPAAQPRLEDIIGPVNPATEQAWSEATLDLWSELAAFPTTATLQGPQWALLARAMVLDDAVLRGQVKLAPEARLQLAKFGVAPDDLARLRIAFVQADEADDKAARRRAKTEQPASQQRYPGLRAVD